MILGFALPFGFYIICAILAIVLSLFYGGLMVHYVTGWRDLPIHQLCNDFQAKTSITLVIPARNEAHNIGACLASIFKNEYPRHLLNVYVIDDFSEDQTAAIVAEWSLKHTNLHLIQMKDFPVKEGQNAFKKAAISKGIEAGRGELIICTDADCVVPPNWLQLMAHCFEKEQVHFIAAPVLFHKEKGLLGLFQSLDFAGMMLITGAGIRQGWMHMSNGANLAYSREAYEKVGGFQGIDNLASGDDMLLMQKIAKTYPGQIGFLKNRAAVVNTLPQSNYRDFLRQRIRWASKSSYYPEWKVTAALAGVFFFCWMIVFSLLLSLVDIVFFGSIFLSMLLIKSWVDFYLLREASLFFRKEYLLRSFVSSQFFHIAYICWVGLVANFQKTYIWKERRVR